jgi:hypothetical protein
MVESDRSPDPGRERLLLRVRRPKADGRLAAQYRSFARHNQAIVDEPEASSAAVKSCSRNQHTKPVRQLPRGLFRVQPAALRRAPPKTGFPP